MKYVLDVSKWVCGGALGSRLPGYGLGEGLTEMLNHEGFMCCLGQFAAQAGVDKDHLYCKPDPASVSSVLPFGETRYDETFVSERNRNTTLADHLMVINDDRDDYTIAEKINQIRKLLEAEGHELEVINEDKGHQIS